MRDRSEILRKPVPPFFFSFLSFFLLAPLSCVLKMIGDVATLEGPEPKKSPHQFPCSQHSQVVDDQGVYPRIFLTFSGRSVNRTHTCRDRCL